MESYYAMDFVEKYYEANLVTGWLITAKGLVIWSYDEVHVWDLDEDCYVSTPEHTDDLRKNDIIVHEQVDMPDIFLDILFKYAHIDM